MNTNIQIEDVSQVLRRVNVEIPDTEVDKKFGAVMSKLAKKAQLPGFRKGKAPMNLIVKAYGMESIGAEVANDLINESIKALVTQDEIKPLFPPQLDEVKDLPSKGKGFQFSFSIEVAPHVEVGNYTGHCIDVEQEGEDQAYVDSKLEEIRQAYPEITEVEALEPYSKEDSDKGISYTVFFSQKSFAADGSPIDELSSERMYLRVDRKETINSLSFRAILEHFKLKGCKPGDELEFVSQFPENEATREMLRDKLNEKGEVARVEVQVSEIEKAIPMDLGEELAKKIDFENIEQLKNRILDNVKHENLTRRLSTLRKEIVQKILEKHPLEIPPSMVHNALEDHLKKLEKQYMFNIERTSQFANLQRDQIELEIQSQFLMAKISEKEGLEWSEEAYRGYLSEYYPDWNEEKINKQVAHAAENGLDSNESYPFGNYQVMQFLLKNNKINPIPLKKDVAE